MSVKHLHHVTLAVPDVATQKLFYEDFGLIGKSVGDRVVLRCKGRKQDQVIVIPDKKMKLHDVSFGTTKTGLADIEKRIKRSTVQPLSASPKWHLMTGFGYAMSSTACYTTSISAIQQLGSADPSPRKNRPALI